MSDTDPNILDAQKQAAAAIDLPAPIESATEPNASAAIDQVAVAEKVVEVLRDVYDPEIPVSIYELGLVYKIDVSPQGEVVVRMTLTAPACPVAETLPPEVEQKISCIPEVTKATVDLVWDPPWTREMMSEAARLQLGM